MNKLTMRLPGDDPDPASIHVYWSVDEETGDTCIDEVHFAPGDNTKIPLDCFSDFAEEVFRKRIEREGHPNTCDCPLCQRDRRLAEVDRRHDEAVDEREGA